MLDIEASKLITNKIFPIPRPINQGQQPTRNNLQKGFSSIE